MDIKTKFKELKAKVKKEYEENKLFYNLTGVLVAVDSAWILTEVVKAKGYKAGFTDGYSYGLAWVGDKCGIKTEFDTPYKMRIYPEISGKECMNPDWIDKSILDKMATDGMLSDGVTLAEAIVAVRELK